MMTQTLVRRCAVVLMALGVLSGAAQAHVLQADVALRGQALGSANPPGLAACLAECSRTAACTGFNFDPAAKATCSLHGGALSEMPFKGVQSCRMPCDGRLTAEPQTVAPKTVTLPGLVPIAVKTTPRPLPTPPAPPVKSIVR